MGPSLRREKVYGLSESIGHVEERRWVKDSRDSSICKDKEEP